MSADQKNHRVPVTLRLPKELVAEIDAIREELPVAIPRNTWIAETIAERIEKEISSRGKRYVAK
jgi:hypothetical protein